MGTIADSLFSVLMSWVRALVSGIWALFSSEGTTPLEFLARNWVMLAAVIIAAGLVIDWLVWLIRWQPYHIWAVRLRRLLRIPMEDEEEDEEEAGGEAGEAYAGLKQEPSVQTAPQPRRAEPQERQWMPLERPVLDETQKRQVLEAAERVPDERQYPGMRYDGSRTSAGREDMKQSTQRLGAVHSEGPGAAEVSRRRAEIDAWQKQLQEEARQKAQAEQAARMQQTQRLHTAAAANLAEQDRLAREQMAQREAQRLKAESEAAAAREAEQARAAQEEYLRQMEEYRIKRAQYERDMEEYRRKKAEYDAAMQARADQSVQEEAAGTAQMAAAEAGSARRRRRGAVSYGDMVSGETVSELPAAPDWTKGHAPVTEAAVQPAPKEKKTGLLQGGIARMAQMLEEEEQEITGIAALPPRVDRNKAYRPAKKPEK